MRIGNIIFLAGFMATTTVGTAAGLPAVFPIPQEMNTTAGHFVVDQSVRIVLPNDASSNDEFDVHEFMAELSDRHGVAVPATHVETLAAGRKAIVIGAYTNPLVREACRLVGVTVDAQQPGPEGYVLCVTPDLVLVAGSDAAGAFYGMETLRQLTTGNEHSAVIQGVRIRDWPYKQFRGIRLYLPGRDHIAFFKRFVRDFMALYKYNEVVIECDAAMRLDQHPELNAGWIEFARNMTETRRDRPTGPHGEYVDSTHYDAGDGGVLEKAEVADLVCWARMYHIDVIPELPSLTHSYYLLTRHRELAEMPEAEWPDAYCPSNPGSYKLLFDVLDEYIDVIKPKLVHVGHDEWRILEPTSCPLCRGKDPRELYAADVKKIHAHLARRGVGMALWGDHLIEAVRGVGQSEQSGAHGQKYFWPGGLSEAQVRAEIPKDILIANWFWREGKRGEGEANEVKVQDWGFRQYFGNFTPNIRDWGRRSARPSVIGGAPSAWIGTTEFNFGKDLLYDFLGCSNLLWSHHWPATGALGATIQGMMPEVRQRLTGQAPPSATAGGVRSIRLDDLANATLPSATREVARLPQGATVDLGLPGRVIRVALTETGPVVPVGEDASSLVFVHACEHPAHNVPAYQYVYNFDDTADLIGYYEVLYEDGFVATVPIRYGVNVLEATWPASSSPRTYCYAADPVPCGAAATFFAFEWPNPRLGKVIHSVRFRASSAFRSGQGGLLRDNALLLKAIAVVENKARKVPAEPRSDD